MTEDEMAGWHHRLSGHEFEQAPGDSGGQGSLACCSPWGRKELDTTEGLNNSNILSEVWALHLERLNQPVQNRGAMKNKKKMPGALSFQKLVSLLRQAVKMLREEYVVHF